LPRKLIPRQFHQEKTQLPGLDEMEGESPTRLTTLFFQAPTLDSYPCAQFKDLAQGTILDAEHDRFPCASH
jgi:hypothetical protein